MEVPPFTLEALKDNPLTQSTVPYCIHLTARHDYGPVYSHRYFACPENLEHDWNEVSLVQWFAEGYSYDMIAEKWDMKCVGDLTFFRLTLHPNLGMRQRKLVVVGREANKVAGSDGISQPFVGQIPDDVLRQ